MLAFFVGRYVFVMVGGNISAHPYRAGRPAPTLRWARMCARQVTKYIPVVVEGNIFAHPHRAGVRLILPISLRYARLLGDYGIPIGHRLRPATKS